MACVSNLGKDQIDIVSASCGGASHAPPACSGVRRRSLTALKNFCQNGLDIDDIDEARKANIRSALLDIAFGMSGEYEDSSKEGYIAREYAFSVIELLGPDDDCVEKAKEFVFAILERGYTTGNYLMRVGKWLAKDAKIRTELLDRAEKLLLETHDEKIVNGCNSFIKSL